MLRHALLNLRDKHMATDARTPFRSSHESLILHNHHSSDGCNSHLSHGLIVQTWLDGSGSYLRWRLLETQKTLYWMRVQIPPGFDLAFAKLLWPLVILFPPNPTTFWSVHSKVTVRMKATFSLIDGSDACSVPQVIISIACRHKASETQM